LLGLARLFFARASGSRTGFRTLAFATALSTGLIVVLITFTRALIILIVCHGIFLEFASAEMTFDGLSESI
jgi:hypothetical protein